MSFRFWGVFVVATISLGMGPLSPMSAESLYTKDFEGNWIEVDPREWNLGKDPVAFQPKTTALSYTVSHNDAGTGYGFDDPVYGPARLATVNAVLEYIDSAILDEGRVDVEFNRSRIDGSGTALASAGSFYPSHPPSFQPGRAFTHIVTGVDPNPSLPDIQVTVDFGYTWNSETDDPGTLEFDFFSVMLHEITHGLGILSLVGPDGTSEITGTNPGVFSTFDRFLETGNGKTLFDFAGQFLGTPSDLVGGGNGVYFQGFAAIDFLGDAPRIHAPNPWRDGSSLGHFSAVNSVNSVMLPSISSGIKRRSYRPYELGVLHDLGYQVVLPSEEFSEVANWTRYE